MYIRIYITKFRTALLRDKKRNSITLISSIMEEIEFHIPYLTIDDM